MPDHGSISFTWYLGHQIFKGTGDEMEQKKTVVSMQRMGIYSVWTLTDGDMAVAHTYPAECEPNSCRGLVKCRACKFQSNCIKDRRRQMRKVEETLDRIGTHPRDTELRAVISRERAFYDEVTS